MLMTSTVRGSKTARASQVRFDYPPHLQPDSRRHCVMMRLYTVEHQQVGRGHQQSVQSTAQSVRNGRLSAGVDADHGFPAVSIVGGS